MTREQHQERKRAWKLFWLVVWLLLIVLAGQGVRAGEFQPSKNATGTNSPITAARPYWTEHALMHDADFISVVGVATLAKSMEEGRRLALQEGLQELSAYAGVSVEELVKARLQIDTQRTFEEFYPDGTVTVFRLLRCSTQQLLAVVSAHATMPRRDTRFAPAPPIPAVVPPNSTVADIWARVRIRTVRACQSVARGMVADEVRRTAGEPDGQTEDGAQWFYGTARVFFVGPSVVGIVGCG